MLIYIIYHEFGRSSIISYPVIKETPKMYQVDRENGCVHFGKSQSHVPQRVHKEDSSVFLSLEAATNALTDRLRAEKERHEAKVNSLGDQLRRLALIRRRLALISHV